MRLRILLASFFWGAFCCSIGMAANVVVLDDSTFVEASLTDAVTTYRRVLSVPDEKSKRAAFWMCMLDKSNKLSNFSATFKDANGKVLKKLKKGDLQTTELSSSLADDSYTYYTTYEPVSYPVIVTFEWTVSCHDGVISYPAFSPIDDFDEEVNHASYTIRCTTDNPCRYKLVNCESVKGKVAVEKRGDGSIKAVFDNLPAIKQESYSLPLYRQLPMVMFAPDKFSYLGTQGRLDTWQSFGRWQFSLLAGRGDLPETVKQKVHEMTDALPSKREKIARLYQYLYDNTRYVSIQLGIGGYQPAKASEVAMNGFGDCKGLSNYMIALLREVGIPAIYAAISTTHADLLADFPNLNQLNHAIVAVPMERDTLWLECTNARIPLGYVHEDIAGHQAVLITADGGKMVRLPQYADMANVQHSQIKLGVAANGQVRMDCRIRKTNKQYEDALPLLMMNAEEQRKVVLTNLYCPAAQVALLDFEEEKGQPVITTHLEVSSDKYANVSGKRIFLKVNPLKAASRNISSQADRKSAFTIVNGYTDDEDIVISLPEGYQVETMPEGKELNTRFATFKLAYQKEEKSLHVLYHLVMHAGTYTHDDFAEFVKVKNSIATAYRQQIVLVKP